MPFRGRCCRTSSLRRTLDARAASLPPLGATVPRTCGIAETRESTASVPVLRSNQPGSSARSMVVLDRWMNVDMDDAQRRSVTIVGAGVIGLTAGIDLLETFLDLRCSIIADWLPGDDRNIEYASAWAGAHHVSHARADDAEQIALDAYTLRVFEKQHAEHKTDSLMWIDQFECYMEGADNGSDMAALEKIGLPGFRQLKREELLPGAVRGVLFKTLTIDTQPYLVYLASAKATKAQRCHPGLDIIDGMGSKYLGDVSDDAMYPVRGQLCVIRAPWIKHGKTVAGKGNTSYTIPRSSGMVIVGGTRGADDWHDKPRPETTRAILERALQIDRDLLPPEKREHGTWQDIDLVEEAVGRRPGRRGGIRFELVEKDGCHILHNYGHAGFGWQSSWGYAQKVVDTLRPLLQAEVEMPRAVLG